LFDCSSSALIRSHRGSQLGAAESCLAEISIVEAGAIEPGLVEAGSAQLGPAAVGSAAEVGPAEVGATKVDPLTAVGSSLRGAHWFLLAEKHGIRHHSKSAGTCLGHHWECAFQVFGDLAHRRGELERADKFIQ